MFFDPPESAGFAVAGGAAVVAQGVIHRQTPDVDMFPRSVTSLGGSRVLEEPVDATDLGPILSPRDLAARKTLALFGRAEAGISPRHVKDLRAWFHDWAAALNHK